MKAQSMLTPTCALRSSWASTLRLPKATFPPRAIPADQPRYLKQCTDDLYQWQRAASPRRPMTFVLHDGPPYANGNLHVGHALNKILKDITCRAQLLSGHKIDYVPGWDCHGLPIELKALEKQKELGVLKEHGQLDAVVVRKAARALAAETVEQQKAEFRQWAIMADWDNAWMTMDKEFELKQLGVFKNMFESGLIYRRFKPVYWSPSSQTALAEAELEYNADHRSTAAYVKFLVDELPPKLKKSLQGCSKHLYITIWTTTPWTLLANKAIAVHSDMEYKVVLSATHGALIVATHRLAEVGTACREDLSRICLATFQGSDLVGATYCHPALETHAPSRPVLHADFVSAESGSGLVHLAPGHGMDDYKLCLPHGIEPFAPVDDKGCFTKEALPGCPDLVIGKNVLKDGTQAVLDLLSARGALVALHRFKHSYPYDWRMKQPIIIRATQQWFADVGEIRGAALRSLDEVTFIPDGGKERLSSFVRNRSEWCVSRQRAWGVPIPALYDKDSGAALLTSESIENIIKVVAERGIDAWWTDNEYDPIWTPPSLRGRGEYRRGKDTMDVWFDSGTSWTQSEWVANIYLEGTDQHRGWFQSSLLTKIAFQNASGALSPPKAPYQTLITHGFALDQHAKKMSKSEGNVISPVEIMDGTLLPPMKPRKSQVGATASQSPRYDAMGPDALRLWVAGCDYTRDVVVGQKVLKAINSTLVKLRTTFKLLIGLLDSKDAEQIVQFSELGINDQLVLLRSQRFRLAAAKAYDSFEYQKVISAVNHYVNVDLSAVYIESIKDRLYADSKNSRSRTDAQAVIWQIFQELAEILAPVTPLLVEEACDHLPAQLSFHPLKTAWACDQLWPTRATNILGAWENKLLEQDLPYLVALNVAVKAAQETARAEKKMGSSLQSFVSVQFEGTKGKALDSNGNPPMSPLQEALERHAQALSELLVVSQVDLRSPPDNAAWSYTAPCEVGGHSAVVWVYAPSRDKCERCWKYDVPKENPLEAMLCGRCVGVLEGLRDDVQNIFEGMPLLNEAATQCRELGQASSLKRSWDF